MSNGLKPWAYGPFELVLHAELHMRDGQDFDRRIALISYDNAIEVAITAYLSLNPIQRHNLTYTNAELHQWLKDYHTKIDFFLAEIGQRGSLCLHDKAEIVWYHELRNDQYHGGRTAIPQLKDLEGIREIALWVLSTLFDVPEIEPIIEQHLTGTDDHPKRTDKYDKLIGQTYGVIEIAGRPYYTSEALHGVDPFAYGDVGTELDQPRDAEEPTEDAEGDQ